jgi:hypothetical protein
MEPARMSRILMLAILVTCLALSGLTLSGCDPKDETTTTADPTETSTTATAPDQDPSSTTTTQPEASPQTSTQTTTGTTAPMSDPPQTTVPKTIIPDTSKTTVQPPYTPPKGDDDRAAIMDAQRTWMASKGLPSDVVFVVDWLRISSGWAYSVAAPQSVDGVNKYEPIMFLLRDSNGWKVVDVFGTEGEVSEDLDPKAQLLARNPGAPASIFP